MTQENLLDDFIAESMDMMEGLESHLRSVLETGDATPLHRVFRAVHTVKGNAGFLDCLGIKNAAHQIEDVLDRLRSGNLLLTARMLNPLLRCLDMLCGQIQRVETTGPEKEIRPDELELLAELAASVESRGEASDDPAVVIGQLVELVQKAEAQDAGNSLEAIRQLLTPFIAAKDATPASSDDWIALGVGSPFFCNGSDITELVRPCLEFFLASRKGPLPDPVVDKFLLDSELLLARLIALGEIAAPALLKGMIDECRIIHGSPIDLDELLVSTLQDKVESALKPMRTNPPPAPAAPAATTSPVAKPTPETGGDDAAASATVRVRAEALDQFMWHVGDAFLTAELYRDLQNRLSETNAPPPLLTEFNQLNRELTVSVGKLQQSVMDVRRVPVGTLLNKIPKMARQLADKLGKRVEVIVEGADQRVDKSLVQDLDGPMTHLVRNAIDHGLETPAERETAGKPPVGRLAITCKVERETLLLLITDDGRGIDQKRIVKKAIDRGLISGAEACSYTADEINMLLCRPGFSTAETVSDVSGRGVGLDVVRSTIERNGGRLEIDSIFGSGTTFRMRFRLKSTVLMFDGLLCESANRQAAFAVDFVKEVVRIEPQFIQNVGGAPTMKVRDRIHPVISLRRVLGLQDQSASISGDGILLQHQHRSALLRVDRLNGYRRMVLKGFDRSLVQGGLLSGVSHLGGSKLALIFDVPELLKQIA